jgi:hypothetical protein
MSISERIKVYVCPGCVKRLCDYAMENKRYTLARHLAKALIKNGYAKALDEKQLALALMPSSVFYRCKSDTLLEIKINEWIPSKTTLWMLEWFTEAFFS